MNKETLLDIDNLVRDWLTTLDDIIPQLIKQMVTSTKNRFDLVTNVDKSIQQNFEQFYSNIFQITNFCGRKIE